MPDNQTSVPAVTANQELRLSLTYGERLSLLLQANWATYPEGDFRRIPSELMFEIIRNNNEDILPLLLENYDQAIFHRLSPDAASFSEKEKRMTAVLQVISRLRYCQYYRESPAFSGISDDKEGQKFARYFWILYRVYDRLEENGDEVFPGLKVDFTKSPRPFRYWEKMAVELPIDDMIFKSFGWKRRKNA